MLVGLQNGIRKIASDATKGERHSCPNCNGELVLKQGRKVVHHFAHKSPVNCSWQHGETRAHMNAKLLIERSLRNRGLQVEVEHIVPTLTGDRRSDVSLWHPQNNSHFAFELQHSSISVPEIECRAYSYAQAGITQIWIPFLRPIVWENGTRGTNCNWILDRYPALQFERWIHGFNLGNGMWMYDPIHMKFWHARLTDYEIYVEHTTWYESGGVENSAGGYRRKSKKFKTLSLNGPFNFDLLKIHSFPRNEFRTSQYNWPSGYVGNLVP